MQAESAMRCQFHDEPVGQRLQAVLLGIRVGTGGTRARLSLAGCEMRAIDGIRRYCIDIARWAADIIVTLGGGRRFVLGTDITPLDPQAPIAIHAHDVARAGHHTGTVAERPGPNGAQRNTTTPG